MGESAPQLCKERFSETVARFCFMPRIAVVRPIPRARSWHRNERCSGRFQIIAAVAMLLALQANQTLLAQGTIFSASGPVNRSMGGASVAAPIDAIGAIYWNPASISGMERNETAFGLGLLIPNHTVSSSIGGVGGSSEADAGIFPVPNIGWVHRPENSRLTYGLGVNTAGGFGTNLPIDPTNPALAPVSAWRTWPRVLQRLVPADRTGPFICIAGQSFDSRRSDHHHRSHQLGTVRVWRRKRQWLFAGAGNSLSLGAVDFSLAPTTSITVAGVSARPSRAPPGWKRLPPMARTLSGVQGS